MRKKNKLICGVGVNDSEVYVRQDGVLIKSYTTWTAMLNRCYSIKHQTRYPTYVGCTVCTEWLTFSNFKKWYDANYREGLELDKDILVEGNKIYSPETCRFVPKSINYLLLDHRNARGDLPIGVIALTPDTQKGRVNITYQAHCNDGLGNILRKTFKTLEEAVAWYSATKTRVVAEVATRALDAGLIQSDIYNALIARTF